MVQHLQSANPPSVIRFTNCRVLRGKSLVQDDLWINPKTGKIVQGEEVFFGQKLGPNRVIDLGGRIVAPGFIETQINGAFGFDLSEDTENVREYAKGLAKMRRSLIQTGVTSFLPTITSQKSSVYQKVLPYLKPSSASRYPTQGAEILGAHCEGPFLHPCRNGIHPKSVLLSPSQGLDSLVDCYGASNLVGHDAAVKLVTLAPELPGALAAIQALSDRGIIASIGHSTTTYENAVVALEAGASTITHLFNAMEPLHHRNPGIFGLLGVPSSTKPFFGIIADGIHLHPTCVNIAWHAHPDGLILVTDAMFAAGLTDGVYDWTNGDKIEKEGQVLKLVGSEGKIAGSATTMVACVINFMNWTGATIGEALNAVTAAPAAMLGIKGSKGCLGPGADADLVILQDSEADGERRLVIDEVWKFGELIYHG